MSSSMILHCGGREVDFETLQAVPLPEATKSYVPIAFDDLVTNVVDAGSKLLYDYELTGQQFALAPGRMKDAETGKTVALPDAKMFGLLNYRKMGEPKGEMGMSIALRSSHDRSMKIGIALGARVFVCDNMAHSGSIAKVELLHTGDVLKKLRREILVAVDDSADDFIEVRNDAEEFKRVSCTSDEAYKTLGLAFGRGILKPTQLGIAKKAWENEEYRRGFGETDSVWSLYNVATEALKTTPMQKTLERHIEWHRLVKDVVVSDFHHVSEEGKNGDDLIRARLHNA